MKTALSLLLCLLLIACAAAPATPHWQLATHTALNQFVAAYLEGDSRLAQIYLTRARSEAAKSGRADGLGQIELTRCALRVASLDYDDCPEFAPLAADAAAAQSAYADFLRGHWETLEFDRLPPQHRRYPRQTAEEIELSEIDDPLARLVAAGVLLRVGRLHPSQIEVIVETAADQGWRRPLLAWLGIQKQRAAADPETQAKIRRRIERITQTRKPEIQR